MKNKKIGIVATFFLTLVIIFGLNSKVQAATASISASSTEVKVGESVKITISLNRS